MAARREKNITAAPPRCLMSVSSPLAWEQAWHGYLDLIYSKTRTAIAPLQLEHESEAPIQAFLSPRPTSIASNASCGRWQHKNPPMMVSQTGGEPVAREKHDFEAVKRVLDYGEFEMDMHRKIALEITLENFQSKNGQGYLDLLKSLSTQGVPANRYVRIKHPAVGAE